MDQWEYRVAYVDSRGRISCDGVEFIRQSGEHRTTFVSRYLTALPSVEKLRAFLETDRDQIEQLAPKPPLAKKRVRGKPRG